MSGVSTSAKCRSSGSGSDDLDAARRAGQHRLVVDGAGAIRVRLPCPGQVGAEVPAVTVLDDEEAARRHVDHRADAAEQGADDRAAPAAVRADGDDGQRLVGHRVEEWLPQGDPSRPRHLAAGRTRGHAGLIQPIECWRTHRRALLGAPAPSVFRRATERYARGHTGRQEERYSTDIPVGTQLRTVTGSTHHHYSLYAAPMGPWSFVGRAAELNRLIAAATDEGARGLIFSGSAGIGKSRLLREGVGAARHRPVRRLGRQRPTSPPPACRSAVSRRCCPPTSRPASPPPACCAGPSTRCTSRPPAGRSCWRSTTPTCSTRRPPRWSTWSPAPSSATVLGTLRSGEQVPLPIRALWTDDLVDHAELAPLTVGRRRRPARRDARRPGRDARRRSGCGGCPPATRCCCASW